MNTLFLTIFNPQKAFNQIKVETLSIMIFIIIILLVLTNLILMIPIHEKSFLITLTSKPLTPQQSNTMIELNHKMRYLNVVVTGLLYVILFLFHAYILHLIARVSKNKLAYMKVLQLLVYCNLIIVLGDLINTALLYWRGIDNIEHAYDIILTGITHFISIEQVGTTGYVFLNSINLFQLWFVVLLSIGFRILTDIKPVKSIVISIFFWLITILIPVLFVYFSQSTLAKNGAM